jgi:hypothetical protein
MNNNLKTIREKQFNNPFLSPLTTSFLLLLLLFFSFSLKAQENNQAKEKQESLEKEQSFIGNNEIKFNTLYAIGGVLEVEYERILKKNASMGIILGVPIDAEYYYRFSAFPYYRFYFGEKRAAGFFIGAQGAILVDPFNDEISLLSNIGNPVITNENIQNKVNVGLGLTLGGKFFIENGWVAQLSLDFGRVIGVADDDFQAFGRLGISVGKRF